MTKSALALFFLFTGLLILTAEETKVYTIGVLPIYNLSYSSNQDELDSILNSITDTIRKSAGYKLIDKTEMIELLKKKKIDTDTILLDMDLNDIQKKIDVDFLVYNIIAIDEKNIVTVYTKTTNRKNEVRTVEKSVRNVKSVKNYFKATIVEAVKEIETETQVKLELPQISLSALTPLNKAGLITAASGAAVGIAGVSILLTDTLYYMDIVRQKRRDYRDFAIPYSEYETAYDTNIALFSAGLTMTLVGVAGISVGLPLFFIKDSTQAPLTLDVEINDSIRFALNYKIDITY